MPDVKTLVEDIYAKVDEGFEPEFAAVLDFQDAIAEALLKQFKPSNRVRGDTLRMSALGKADCQLWHQNAGTEAEALSADTRLKFLFGDIIEALLIYLAKEAGHQVTDQQKKLEVDGIVGHMDCKIDGIPVDIKSASSYSFKKFVDGSLVETGNDPFGYIAQISGYCHAEDADEGGFLVMDKQLGKLTYMKVQDIDLIDVPHRIKEARQAIEADEPVRCFKAVPDGKSGNMKLGVNCSYCAYKEPCWSDANDGAGLRLFAYSTGPRWLTEVKREPDVFEVT
jgi:hypothetical protein